MPGLWLVSLATTGPPRKRAMVSRSHGINIGIYRKTRLDSFYLSIFLYTTDFYRAYCPAQLLHVTNGEEEVNLAWDKSQYGNFSWMMNHGGRKVENDKSDLWVLMAEKRFAPSLFKSTIYHPLSPCLLTSSPRSPDFLIVPLTIQPRILCSATTTSKQESYPISPNDSKRQELLGNAAQHRKDGFALLFHTNASTAFRQVLDALFESINPACANVQNAARSEEIITANS